MKVKSYKFKRLGSILKEMGSVLVAYSGGVDSTFLLKVASSVLPKDKILAVTANSPTYPNEELVFAKSMAKSLGVRHRVINTGELRNKEFSANPLKRCYFCKKELFSKLKDIASKSKLNFVLDASNVTDKTDFRPGSIAKKEFAVRSPLAEAGFTKDDIRFFSRKMGLVIWDKPSLACLASRIPYGTKITAGLLERINKAEVYLRQIGFKQVRLRHYDYLCRIEVLNNDLPRLLRKRNQVVDKLKRLGYNYITLDLEGYRTGSMNEVKK